MSSNTCMYVCKLKVTLFNILSNYWGKKNCKKQSVYSKLISCIDNKLKIFCLNVTFFFFLYFFISFDFVCL